MRIREIPGSDKTGGSCHQLPPVLPPVATSRAQNKKYWSVHIPNRKLTEIDCVMTSTTLETIMSYFRACRLYLGYLLVANWWQTGGNATSCHQYPVLCPRETPHWKNFLSQMIILSYWDIFCLFRALVKVPELSRRFVWFPFKSACT